MYTCSPFIGWIFICFRKHEAFKTDRDEISFEDAYLFAVVSDEAQLEFKDMQQIALGCKMVKNGSLLLLF